MLARRHRRVPPKAARPTRSWRTTDKPCSPARSRARRTSPLLLCALRCGREVRLSGSVRHRRRRFLPCQPGEGRLQGLGSRQGRDHLATPSGLLRQRSYALHPGPTHRLGTQAATAAHWRMNSRCASTLHSPIWWGSISSSYRKHFTFCVPLLSRVRSTAISGTWQRDFDCKSAPSKRTFCVPSSVSRIRNASAEYFALSKDDGDVPATLGQLPRAAKLGLSGDR
jgi:hypothetical protein